MYIYNAETKKSIANLGVSSDGNGGLWLFDKRLRLGMGGVRFARDSPLEGNGFELPVPRVLEPSHLICLIAFCRRDRRRIGTEAISCQRKEAGGLPITVGCTRSKRLAFLFTHLLGRAM